jgi:hypothetical protein
MPKFVGWQPQFKNLQVPDIQGPETSNDVYVEELKALLTKSPTRGKQQQQQDPSMLRAPIMVFLFLAKST